MKHCLRLPELKLTAMLFGLAIFLCGCSSTYSVSSTGKPDAEYSYRAMNKELKGQDVKIELKDGGEISATEVIVSNDSVAWLDASTTEKSRVATQRIKRIVFKNHFVGGLEGFGFGAVGAGTGLTLAFPVRPNSAGIPSYAPAVAGGVLGGGIGFITGLIIGHSYNYEFPATEQSDSSQMRK